MFLPVVDVETALVVAVDTVLVTGVKNVLVVGKETVVIGVVPIVVAIKNIQPT